MDQRENKNESEILGDKQDLELDLLDWVSSRSDENQASSTVRVLPGKPKGSTWTDEQWRAVVDGGQNVLVAAAAGSGKTAVLVERIIRTIRDEEHPVHVDQLLVATFTKAAASEMRERIRLALERELEAKPDSEHLRRQLALLNRASITTLHSFCLEVIQRHFQSVQLDPAFRIANETETELLRQDVLKELFEQRYADGHVEFKRMVDWFSGERSDEAAFRLVQQLYDFSRSHPWPDDWMKEMAASFEVKSVDELGRTPWVASVMQDARLTLNGIVELLRQAYRLLDAPGGPEPYREALIQELSGAAALAEAAENEPWEKLHASFDLLSFGRLAACRGDKYDKSLQEQVKRLRDQAKARLQQLRDELFRRTPEQFLQELTVIAPVMHTLADVVIEFGIRFEEAKRTKGWLDFSDLEHYCLSILRDPSSTPDHTIPSEAARQYEEQYVEILLDEYQDTNMVQEAIVNLITRSGAGNRFMVGDVKQSIYRFRLAEPGLFLSKYESYSSDSSEHKGIRIDLARNFRSRQEVVDAVNMLFRQIMNERVAELKYDEAAELVCGASYPTLEDISEELHAAQREPDREQLAERQNYATELVLIEKASAGADTEAAADENEDEEPDMDGSSATSLDPAEMETARLEARAIAGRIRRLLGDEGTEPFLVYDKHLKRMRPSTYRDIVILLRATQAWAPLMVEELRLEGIPAYAEFNTGYFQATEVEVVLSLLRVIDNPQQDIPLAAVLRSPIVGLTPEELAHIRLVGKGISFYDAVCRTVKDEGEKQAGNDASEALYLQDKLYRFLYKLEHWRIAARQGSLSQLIWQLYRETGYYEWVGGLAGGMQRQANLRALYDRARQYESSSIRGLFRFLRFIDRMRDTGGDLGTARALGEQEDVVRIMTIHKSKGLEFPIVFVAGLSKRFNQQDLNSSFLMHKQLGFGPKFVDEELRVSYPTLPNLAIRRQMKLELLAEEMRVLYVALTRPKEKMILIGTVNDPEKAIREWGEALDVESLLLPDYMVARARSYMDWIGPSVIRHKSASEWRRYAGLPNRNGECLLEDQSEWRLSIMSAAILASGTAIGGMELDEDKADLLAALARLEVQEEMPASDWQAVLDERLKWRDPNRIASLLPAKTSVTEMKRMAASEEWPADQWVAEPDTELSPMLEEVVEGGASIENAPSLVMPKGDGASASSPANSEEGFTLHLQRPKFMEASKVTPAERGTMYHLLMQHMPLHLDVTVDTVRATLLHLVQHQYMSDKQAEAIDQAAVAGFFQSEVGRQLVQASWVKRELPFSYGLTAAEAYTIELTRQMHFGSGKLTLEQDNIEPDSVEQGTQSGEGDSVEIVKENSRRQEKQSIERFVATSTFAARDASGLLDEETVLVQGVIDCMFEWEGQLVLLDYKTDKVLEHRGGLKALTEHYRFQLNLYARAIEQIFHRPVDRKVLYFFDAGQACEL
ncbi:UvrD-helicase domain-containing protein [Paenibacillus alvei]|uniref:UvrD-helicase domain-containing protein n=1 Tax=Paenibacillus alvei TaxID=44250 RepID=UPI0018CDC68A|nr:UvrD-helicase domain-containing protein [Paenibacillus alvei]MCY9582246.1 UvrD-helicase domain-containing protein [Paenibacillus alvei]MCY9587048.1 UvrD-helicase domain-containing protein [Paenibacillus alvei]